jgi:hypothetical protein
MKNAILLSAAVLATSAFAQNSTSSYIPSGISTGCSSFLTSLNADPTLATCLNELLTATSAFSSSGATSSDVTPALATLCTDNGSCSNTATRASLTSFWDACTDELSGDDSNEQVQDLYDLLYDFTPMRAAVCTKDSNTGGWCVSALSDVTPTSSKKRRSLLKARDDPVVNTNQLSTSGAPFLYMLPSSDSDQLCTACGKAVLQAYVTWEATIPYAFGLNQSPILGGQSALWNAVETTCGSSFIDTITANSDAAPLAALANGASLGLKAPAVLVTLVGAAVALLI